MSNRMTVPLEEIRFPSQCAACGGAAETTVAVELRRGVDLLFVRYERIIRVDVPVCASCRRKRRWAGWLALPSLLLGMLVAALFAMDFNMSGRNGPALALLILVLAMMLFGRLGLDDYLAWRFVGVHGILKARPEPHARFAFRRPGFLEAMLGVNPSGRREGA